MLGSGRCLSVEEWLRRFEAGIGRASQESDGYQRDSF